ncbi:hypothetical protein LshimejAT787_1500080 [Lyophyllum shimeji]|uniref:Uncharacterized protein n=1 Tax=Lyophyllum shimeji TaxID=47721 RepID=A0A9P3UQE2_LYOSH|nr:hypothetical protein LshimejAT787_1500080 [Lyophyllum shimeji]
MMSCAVVVAVVPDYHIRPHPPRILEPPVLGGARNRGSSQLQELVLAWDRMWWFLWAGELRPSVHEQRKSSFFLNFFRFASWFWFGPAQRTTVLVLVLGERLKNRTEPNFGIPSLQGLKFFVTSRKDPHLVAHLKSFEDKQFYRLEQMPIEEAKADIMTYLNASLSYLKDMRAMEKLVTQAAGLFIYAMTVVKYLEGRTIPGRKEAICRLLDSGIPKEMPLLDGLYFRVLEGAFAGVRDDDVKRWLDILHTSLCSAEPPSLPLVAELLFPPDEHEPDSTVIHTETAGHVIAGLHAVLYTENDKVFSYHKSFTDFIFDKNRAKHFACEQAKHHRLLTKACFRVMDRLKFNIANIESSYILDHDNPALLKAVEQNIPPALSYSCRNWGYHLSAVTASDSEDFCGILSKFLQLRILFWIEAMNLLGYRGLCSPMLRAAGERVRKHSSRLADNLAEATNFAMYFSSSPASLSTPHPYLSVLAMWPRDLEPCGDWRLHFPGIPCFTSASQQSGSTQLITVDVESSVMAVAVSTNGNHIVSGSWDNSVRVWDASTGEQLKELNGHTARVTSVAFSTDRNHIVSGSGDKSVRVWDASTGEQLKELNGHTARVTSVAFSTDRNHIVSGSGDKSVRVWDTLTGEQLKDLNGHSDWVTSVAFSTDGNHIVKSVRVWDASTGSDDYIREKVRGSNRYTGWLLSPSHPLPLIFVPPDALLPDSSNILTIPRSASSFIDLTNVTFGVGWANCYRP